MAIIGASYPAPRCTGFDGHMRRTDAPSPPVGAQRQRGVAHAKSSLRPCRSWCLGSVRTTPTPTTAAEDVEKQHPGLAAETAQVGVAFSDQHPVRDQSRKHDPDLDRDDRGCDPPCPARIPFAC